MPWLKFILFILFISSSLYADVENDLKKINQIDDFYSCLNTLRSVTQDNVKRADPNAKQRAKEAVDSVFSSIDFWAANQKPYEFVAWDLYPKFVRAYALLNGYNVPLNGQFTKEGYIQGQANEELNANFLNEFQYAKHIPFLREDCNRAYISSDLNPVTEESLNQNHIYLMLEDRQFNALKPLLQSLEKPITECLGMPWRIATVRAWKTPAKAEKFGPNEWHTDGLPLSALKIMYYPLGASLESGSVELRLPQGNHIVQGGAGTWVFFKNSEVLHRGVAPKFGERFAVEITILPSLKHDLNPHSAGQNARNPALPWQKPYTSSHPLYRKGEFVAVNIGGGPHWSCPEWLNLEEVVSPTNLHSFHLFPNCRFPLESESIKTVYTSHALEHLNIPTVYRVLSESNRILEKGGNLLIKIPDYDRALDCWLAKDPSFFREGWNLESIIPIWQRRGVCDCVDHRAAMIFCSFFNDSYGNPFGFSSSSSKATAYFGPPVVSTSSLRELIQKKSPSQIAQALRKIISFNEKNFHYCHQSAWSRLELKEMLNEFDFDVVSFDPYFIINVFGPIPGIAEMMDLSTFCWAKKR